MYQEWQRMTFNKLLDYSCKMWGDREAIVSGDLRLSYLAFKRQVFQLTKALKDLGVKKGDRVAYLVGVVPEWATLYFAVMRLGGIIVPLNLMWTGREIVQGLELTDANVLVMTDTFRNSNLIDTLTNELPELAGANREALNLKRLPHLRSIITLSKAQKEYNFSYDFSGLMAAGAGYKTTEIEELSQEVGPDDECLYLLTSGTTAFPKPAIHTHQTLLFGMAGYADGIEIRETDKMLIIAPNYHVAGILTLGSPLMRGAAVHLIEFYEPEKAMSIIEQEGITIMFGFDVHYLMMKRHPHYGTYNISSLQRTMIGSNPGSYEEIKAMGISHQGNIYGFTEYVACQSYLPYRDRFDEQRMKYSHGRPMFGTEFKVVDPETGVTLGPNEGGELCVKGPALFKGYYKLPKETAECMDNEGFFHSGDFGWLDEQGYVYYRGRIKDTIKSGGENVSAREVEVFLEAETPWVQVAQVFGLPDPKWGEAVTAMVELKPGAQVTEDDLREFCKGKLAGYKIPKRFMFVSASDWLVTPTGKYDKVALRQKLLDALQKDDAD